MLPAAHFWVRLFVFIKDYGYDCDELCGRAGLPRRYPIGSEELAAKEHP
jgi:hypothetical protein